MREVAEMIPHPDEEESNLSSQTLWGILVSLLGFLGKSKPWKISSFAAVSDKSLFHPDPKSYTLIRNVLITSQVPCLSATHSQYFPVVQLLLPSRTILALVCEENSLKRDWNGRRNKIMFLAWNRNIITVLIWERERILGKQSIGVPADVFIFTPKAGNASLFLSNPPENSRSMEFSRDRADLRPWMSCTF